MSTNSEDPNSTKSLERLNKSVDQIKKLLLDRNIILPSVPLRPEKCPWTDGWYHSFKIDDIPEISILLDNRQNEAQYKFVCAFSDPKKEKRDNLLAKLIGSVPAFANGKYNDESDWRSQNNDSSLFCLKKPLTVDEAARPVCDDTKYPNGTRDFAFSLYQLLGEEDRPFFERAVKFVQEVRRSFLKPEPSRGVTPSFGDRTFTVENSDNRLYMLKLEGDVAAFLGRQPFEVAQQMIVKVGHAKDPQQRCDTHNSHLPPKCRFRWMVADKSSLFPGGVEAKQAEDKLEKSFSDRFESLGGEFFLGDELMMREEFKRLC